MDNELETLDSSNEQETSEEIQVDSTEESASDTQSEDVDVEAIKEQNKKLFVRAKHAEEELKKLKNSSTKIIHKAPETKSSKMSLDDLDEAAELLEIPKDDRKEVADYAERKGITVAEAKKTAFIKAFLKTQAEERQTAQATNTATSKRGNSKVSEDVLLDKVRKGEEMTLDEMQRAARYELEQRKNRN